MATREQDVAKGGEVARLKKISERLRSAVAARQQQPGAAATAGQPRPQQPTARQLPATREAARAARLQQIAERVRALADSARSAAAAPEAPAPARPGPEGPIERPTTLGGLRDQLGAMVDRPSPAPADAAALARPRPAAAAATPAERPAVQASPEQLAQMQEDVRRSMPGYVQPGPTVGAEAAKRVAETVPHERAIGLGDRFQHAANRALGTMLGDMPADLLQSIAVLQAELNTFGGDIGADEFKAYQVGQRIREWAEEAFPTNPRLQGEFIADVVPQAFGSSAGFLAAALLGAGMGLPAAATGGAVGALQMTGGLYNEARAMGATEEEARRISLLAGVPLGATEAIPLERMVDRFVRPDLRQGLLRFMAKSGAVGALEEAGQEGLQTTGQNIVAGATFDPGRSVTEGLGEAVAAGAITGGVMSGAMAGAGGAVQRRRSDQTDAEARAGASPTERLEQRRQGLRARLAGIIHPEGEQERQQLRQQRDEERRAAETDSMTGVANATAWERARPGIEADPNLGVVFFDVRGLKAANDLVGYKKGNEVIKSGARAIQEAARQVLGSDVRIFRTGGDEFLAVAPTDKLERLRDRAIELFPSETIGEFPVDLRAGIGRTMEEADAGVRAAKASETGPKPRDMKAGGQPTPAAAAPEPGPGEVRATEIGRLRTIRSSRLRRRGAEDELTGGEEAQVAHHAAQIEGAEPVPRFQPSSGATPPAVAMVPTAELHRDPERFQYKATGSEGVTAELKRVQKYDPKLGGIILVWKDPSDGRTYVVNGHHRHELAERTGHPEMLVRYINDEATTAAEARVIGALANIAEGRGTAVDAAKLFRDAELGPTDLEGAGVSLTGAVAKNGLALANLPTPIFSRVARGEISEARGAIIGGAGLTEEQQLALARLIEQQEDRGRKILDRDVAELARFVAGAGSAEAQQETLFGTETTTQSLALEKASLSAYIRERLAKERRTFGYVTKGGRAQQIEQAGAGKIDTETSGRIATEAAQAEEIYAKESVYSGPISDLLNAAAREVAAGAKERDVRERLYEQVRERIREIIAGRPAASAPGDQTASARGRDQTAEVEPAPAASPEAAQLRAQLAELERKIAAGTASEMDRIDRQAILSQLDDLEGAAPPPTDTETADMFGAPAAEPALGVPQPQGKERPSAQQLGKKPDKAKLIPTRGKDGSVEIRVEPVAELPFGAVAPDDENRFFGSRVEVRDNAGNWIPGTVHRVLNGGRLIEVNVMPDDPQQSFRYGAEDVRVVERVDANAAAAERLQEQAAQIIEGLTDRQARNRIRTLRDGGQHGLANAVEALLEQRAAAQSEPEEVVPHDGWRDSLMKARSYATRLGIRDQVEDWRSTASVVAAIDRHLGASPAPAPADDAARGEIEAAASGEQNTVFTKEAADAALEVLRRKLGGGEVRMGLDPELMMAAITRGGFHVERGIRTFAAWSRVMIQEVGEGIRPYLRSIYSAIRTWPGFDSAGMSSDAEVEAELSAEPEAAEEEAAPEPTPEPEPAPAPAEPPLVTQTPGTNLTWRTVTEWMEGMRTLDRRKSSATRHRQMSDHFRALTVGHIERETSTAALIELKEFLKTAGRRSQWVPVGGRDNVNHPDRRHYVELLDAIDRTITRHNRGEVGPVVQRTVETAGNRASEETMRALVRQAQSALRRDLQGEKPAPKTPKQLVDWAELNLGMKHEQDFLLDDVYDAFEGAANLIVHEMIGPQRKVGDPQIRSRLEALREFEERLFNGRTNSAEMKARQQFSTPMPIAEAALFAANVHTGEKVLEPSAGTGNLLNGLPRGDFLVHLNEGDPRRVAVLKELYENVRGAEITQGDALRLPLSGRRYSKIVTNPPYGSIKKKRQYSGFGAAPFGATDIAQRFFAQAMESLAPGGRIVGVMPYNTITDQGINFRRWINENHTPVAYIESPEGSYKTRGVEGRSGQAVIVVVDKGKAAGAAALGRKPLIVEKPTWDEWYEAIEQFGVAGPHFKAQAVEAVDEAPVEAPTEEERPRRQATIIDRSSGTGQTRTAPPEEGGTSDTTPAGTEGAVDPGARGPGEEVGRAGGDRGVSGPRQPGTGSGAGAAARTGRDAGVVATAAPGDTGSAVGAEAAGVVPGLPRRRVEAGPGDSEQRRHEIEAANHSPVFAPYAHGLSTSRAPHPRLVVETRSMAGMPAPPITATLRSSLTNDAWGRDGARGGVSDDQVDAALRVLSAWDRGHGMLIADDVGVGKSREAALVILEALERDPNAKILYTTKNENNVADVMAELRNVASGDPEGHFPAPFIYVGDYPGVKKGEEDLPVPDGPAIYFAHSYNFADFADALKDVQPTAWIADEAHEFKNLQSNRGMAWGELHRDMIQRGINNFAYFTATPAVSLDELAYLYGLRQWEVGGFTDWMDRKLGKATKEQQEAGRAAGQAAMGATRAENQLTGETEGEEGDRALQKGKRQFMSARNDAFAQKVTPAETEQVMRELKGSGHYIARDLWRGGVEFDVEWVDLLGVEGDPRVDPEERRYRLLQAAEEYTRHLPPDAAGEDVRNTFVQGVEARLAGGSNRPAFPSDVFGLGWNWADARIREEGSSPEAQAARERYNEAAELVRDITLAARRYGRMNQRDKRGGLERAQLQQYMKATLFNIRLPEVLKLADESLAQGRQVVISIHSVSGDEDTTPGAEGARDVNSALMAAINAINTREVTKEGRGAEAEFIDLGEMPEALMEVARLKERAAAMPPLRDPVRAIEEHFGPTRVAAITGRQTPKKRKDAMAEFQGGARDVAIISRAGKVGISLHDVNGKGRHLIVSDYEWSADLFKQELGRVDRTGQRSSPKITLVATNIAGERKFASTIAARMASLGATSKGSAESTGTDALDQFEMSGDIPLNAMRNAVEKLSDSERIYFTGAAYVEQRRLPDGTFAFVPIRRPGEKADMRNFLLEMLFHPVEMADRIMQKFVEERESLMTGEAVEALAARRTGRSHGDVLRRTVLSEDPELVLFEARNAAGEKVGLLQGFVTEHIIDIQRVRGTTSEGKPKPRRYVHFTPDDGSEPISGLEVSPGDARRLLAYYKRGERRRLTPADVWEDLQAGDKVQVQGPNGETWELHRRRDGRIQIRGASLSKHNMVLRQLPRGTVSYSQVGNYLFVQGDQAALERFLQRFPPEVQRPAEGEQTEMVREERVPFGQPIEQDRGPAQQSIFQQPRGPQGRTAALDEARQTVSLLEGKVARGAARPSEIRRYESARALIRSLEGQGMSPEDVARATAETEGERPAMDPDVGDLFGGVMEERAGFGEVPTFYSRLVRAIENAPFSRAPAQQWAGYLGKQPIAAGEREWVGIDRFLDEAEGPLTKDDLLDAFEQGAIRLVETVLPQKLPPIEWRPSRGGFYSPEFTIELLPNGKYRLFARGSGVAELFDSLQAAKDRAEEIRARNGRAEIPTRYKLYTEQGGENYREILIQLGGGRERSISREEARSAIRSGQPVVARYQSDEGIASEIVTHLDDLDSLTHRATFSVTEEDPRTQFRSRHFDEPNILVHARVDDRELPNGERVLFIEEIQSDWHQKGRELGYRARGRKRELPPGFKVEPNPYAGGSFVVLDRNGDEVAEGPTREAAIQDYFNVLADAEARGLPIDAVPDAPFKKTDEWVGLMARRLIEEAVRGGYDRISWTTGEQQTARYNKLMRFSRIELEELDSGTRILAAYEPGDGRPVLAREVASDHEIAAYIGKELTQRLLTQPAEDAASGARRRRIEGPDLTIRGEGFRTHYDRIVPRAFQDAAKKLGAKVQIEPIEVIESPGAGANPSIRITDEMRRRVASEGQMLWEPQLDFFDRSAEVVFGSEEAAIQAANEVVESAGEFADVTPQGIPTRAGRLRRAGKRAVRRAWVDIRGQRIRGPEDIHRLIFPFRSPRHERFHVLLLKGERVLSHTMETSGAIDYVRLFAEGKRGWLNRIEKRARRLGADSLILVHNHPSGNPEESGADRHMTLFLGREFAQRGLRLHGHYIIDHEEGTWLEPNVLGGIQTERVKIRMEGVADDWTQYHVPSLRYDGAFTPRSVARLVGDVHDPNRIDVLYLSTQRHAVAIETHKPSSLATIGTWLPEQLRALGAADAVLITGTEDMRRRAVASVNAAADTLRRADFGSIVNGVLEVLLVRDSELEGKSQDELKATPLDRTSFPRARRVFEERAPFEDEPSLPETGRGVGRPGGRAGDEGSVPRRGAAALGRRGVGEAPEAGAPQLSRTARRLIRQRVKPRADLAESGAPAAPPLEREAAEAPNGSTLHPISPVELVRVASELLGGREPFVKKYLRARGRFYPDPLAPQIGLNPSLGRDYDQFARTVAHEVGHLIDFLPDADMNRGNILGRLGTLKNYLSHTLDEVPTNPSLALTPEDRKALRKRAEAEVKDEAKGSLAGKEAIREAVAERYRELVEQEIADRQLLTREAVMEELIALSEWWRPYDVDRVSDGYIKYRQSSPELYADAMSVLLNSPGTLKERAPRFFDAWFAYVERKPEVRQEYEDIQALLGAGEDEIMRARKEELEQDMERFEELLREADNWQDPQGVGSLLKQAFVDRAGPATDAERRRLGGGEAPAGSGRVDRVVRAIRRWRNAPPAHSDEHAVRMALEELNHAENVNRVMVMDIDRLVHRPLMEAGITPSQIHRYLMLKRIAEGDRGGMAEQAKELIQEITGETTWEAAREAYTKMGEDEDPNFDPDLAELAEKGVLNPHGYTPKEAARTLEALKRELDEEPGAERWALLEAKMRVFRQITFRSVEQAVELGVYNRETFEKVILPNKDTYVPFAVLDYFNGRMSAGVRQQMGTVKAIGDTYTAAILKAMALNRANEHQRAKLAVLGVIDVDFPGQAGPVQRIDKYKRERRPERGRENLHFFIDGKPHYREVPKYIARVFERADMGVIEPVNRMLQSFTYRLFHPLYVSWSIAWQTRNIPRDWKRTYKNLAAARAGQPRAKQVAGAVSDIFRLNRAYARTLGAAWAHARRQYHPLIRAMLEDRALTRAFHSFDPNPDDTKFMRLLQEYGISKPENQNLLRRVGRPVEAAGVLQESWTKAATYQLLGELGVLGRERAFIVRNYSGTPDSTRRGLASDAVNSIFMYANVVMAGIRADAEVATQPATAAGYWFRSFLVDFLPKAAMAAAAAGAFGDDAKEWIDKIPSYDLEKYITIPVPGAPWATNANGERKAVYIRIPHDDTNRILAGITWALIMSERPHRFSHALGLVQGELPGFAPWITLPAAWLQAGAGRNPFDTFRGREIVPRNEWEAGGWPRYREMIRWTIGELGIISQALGYFTRAESTAGDATPAETILRSIPGVQSLVKISDRGLDERRWWQEDWENSERAKIRADLSRSIDRASSERYKLNSFGKENLSELERARREQLNAWYRESYLPLTAAMVQARDTKDAAGYERARLQLERETEQLRSAPAGGRARSSRGISRTPSTGRTRSAGSLGRTRSRTTRTREPAAAGR